MFHRLDSCVINTSMPNLLSILNPRVDTISGFARFKTTNGYFPVLRISTDLSATPWTLICLISGTTSRGKYGSRSYVATLGLGIISRSSRGYCFSIPPLKNYISQSNDMKYEGNVSVFFLKLDKLEINIPSLRCGIAQFYSCSTILQGLQLLGVTRRNTIGHSLWREDDWNLIPFRITSC